MTVFIIALLVAFALLELILWQNRALKLNELEIKSQKLPMAFDGYRILHISDLHNAEFGIKNAKLLELATHAQPDIIAITGDLIDRRRIDLQSVAELAERLVKIAPTYYVLGNHEARIDNYEELRTLLCSLGVRILDNKSDIITLNGEKIAIVGVNDPACGADISVPEEEILDEFLEKAFRQAFDGDKNIYAEGLETISNPCGDEFDADNAALDGSAGHGKAVLDDSAGHKNAVLDDSTGRGNAVLDGSTGHGNAGLGNSAAPKNAALASDGASLDAENGKKATIYSVLLAHRPQFFDLYIRHGADLTLSGHVHGGQIRLPFVGGLFAPEQGFFPDYGGGVYKSGESTMVVSRGLGNSKFPLRINNRPEIIVIELKTIKKQ